MALLADQEIPADMLGQFTIGLELLFLEQLTCCGFVRKPWTATPVVCNRGRFCSDRGQIEILQVTVGSVIFAANLVASNDRWYMICYKYKHFSFAKSIALGCEGVLKLYVP